MTDGLWEITSHACQHCMGRILRAFGADEPVVRCSECGAEAASDAPEALCWCGVDLPGHGHPFECFGNPEPSLSAPQEILVRERR